MAETDFLRNHKCQKESKAEGNQWKNYEVDDIVGESIPKLVIFNKFFKIPQSDKFWRFSQSFPLSKSNVHCLNIGI